MNDEVKQIRKLAAALLAGNNLKKRVERMEKRFADLGAFVQAAVKEMRVSKRGGDDMNEGRDEKATYALKNPVAEIVRVLLGDAVCTDGAHHKQWYLERIASELGIELPEHDEGIPA